MIDELANFSNPFFQAVNILENARNSDDKNIQADSVFPNEPAVHFAKRGLASASDFTSSNSRGRPNGLNLAPIDPVFESLKEILFLGMKNSISDIMDSFFLFSLITKTKSCPMPSNS